MLLTGKKVLVLEGTDGIGAAITGLFRDEGAEVVSITVSSESQVAAAFDQAATKMGSIDTLVNAVSDWSVCSPANWTADVWRELSDKNSAIAIVSGRLALEYLRKPGSMCFVSSTWAMATSPEMGLAGASKATLGPINKALALAGAAGGIRANVVVMGLIDTPPLREATNGRSQVPSREIFDETAARVPMQRPGTPAEIAKAVAFLCSDRARMINGASVLVDGGLLYA